MFSFNRMKPVLTRAIVRSIMRCLAGLSLVSLLAPTTRAQAPQTTAPATLQARPLSRSVPDTVKLERDLVYARYGEREVKLDLYLPKNPASQRIPGIVVIHGGAWRTGSKASPALLAIHLAEHGFAAASIDYRMLPEVQFPAPVQDCKAAVRWLRANARKYGIDADRIGAMGGSAGGHLVAMLGTSYKEPKLEGDGGSPGVSSRVQAVVAMATPADLTRLAARANLAADLGALISPVTHVDRDSAPILLLHGDADRTVPMQQSELLLEKYKQAGVPAELVKIPGAPHAFWNSPQWYADVMERAEAFFHTHLKEGREAKAGKAESQ